MRRGAIAALGAAAMLASCVKAGPADPLAQRDVLEALFRYQFGHNTAGFNTPETTRCVTFDQQVLPQEFLDRFVDTGLKVRALHGCQWRHDHYVDTDTGRNALIHYVSHIECPAEDLCTARGGYREGNLSSSENSYRIERKNGVWHVTDERLLWIS